MKYVSLVAAVMAVFFAGYWFDDVDGIDWFLCKSGLSFMLAMSCIALNTRESLSIAAVEIVFILSNLVASMALLTRISIVLWFYNVHTEILNIALSIEIVILMGGTRVGWIYRAVLRLLSNRSNDNSSVNINRNYLFAGEAQCTT